MKRLVVDDGSFPKDGLNTGALRATMHAFARASDRVIFVVPPHLRGIRLDGVESACEDILISGTLVHQSWIATLNVVARRILERFQSTDTIMVVTQSAVFSAVLGLYLRSAKNALLPHKRLYFFDLGQALDIANAEAGGPFLRNYQVRDRTLFKIAGTRA